MVLIPGHSCPPMGTFGDSGPSFFSLSRSVADTVISRPRGFLPRGFGGDDESSECGDANHHDAYTRLDLDPEDTPCCIIGSHVFRRDTAHKANCNHNYAEAKDDPNAKLLANIEASFPEKPYGYRND